MDKFTDRDKLIELLNNKQQYGIATEEPPEAIYTIENHQLADYLLANGVIVPVRCKDCKYCELRYPAKEIGKEAIEGYYCFANKRYLKSTDFCSCGELKELGK